MEQMFEAGKTIHVSRGEILDSTDSIYFILEGVIGQYTTSKTRPKLLFAYRAKELFPLATDTQSRSSGRSYEYKALSKAKLIILPRSEFEILIDEPQNTRQLLAYAQRVMQNQIERIDNLQEEQIRQRLLERLMYIGLRFGTQDGDGMTMDIPMSHVDLASSINTSRETVNRYMKELEQLGIISLSRQMIRINSLAEIQQMLDLETRSSTSEKRYAKSVLVAGLIAGALLQAVLTLGNT